MVFRITHPFHPLAGREFELLDERCTWGEARVYTRDAEGHLKAFPIGWTSRAAPDPRLVLGEGAVHFRVDDLLELARVVGGAAGARRRRRRR